MAQQFGYARLLALAQSPLGAVPGANPAVPCFLAGSACVIQASFFDDQGQAMVPEALSYELIDVATGTVILEPTTLTNPLSVQPVLVTAAQNAMVSNSQPTEAHEAIFSITDRNGAGPFKARCLFELSAS